MSAANTAPILILFMMIYEGDSLKCQQSLEYMIEEQCCHLCLPGERVQDDCSEFKPTTTCTPCTEGTYSDQPTGKRICSDCTKCDAGSGLKIKTPCTNTSDTVCVPQEGFHCVDSTDHYRGCRAAEKHSSCRPGQFINQTGTALSDTVCSNCTDGTFSDGTFSDGTLTSCQPHTKCESKTIKPGTASTDAECEENNSIWATIGIVICILVVLVILVLVLVYCMRKKKCCHRETETDEELRTISNGTPNSISGLTLSTVHDDDDDDDGHHKRTNHLVNGLVNGTA